MNWLEGWINLEEGGDVSVFKALLKSGKPMCKPCSFQRWPRSHFAPESAGAGGPELEPTVNSLFEL